MNGRISSWWIVLVLGVAACGGGSSSEAPAATAVAQTSPPSTTLAPEVTTTTNGPTTSTVTEGEWYGGHLAVGDCFDDTVDASGEYVYTGVPLIVSCAEPHDNEVIAVLQQDEGAYPGSDALGEQGEELCEGAFIDFVGVDWSVSPLNDLWIWPEEDEWQGGGREIVCSLYLPEHKIAGTMKGSGTSARPAEIPDDAPVPTDAVFQRLSETEEGERVGMFAASGSLDDVGAATVAAAAESGLQLRLDGQTSSLILFRYSDEVFEYTIAIHGKEDGAEWWIYYPQPTS